MYDFIDRIFQKFEYFRHREYMRLDLDGDIEQLDQALSVLSHNHKVNRRRATAVAIFAFITFSLCWWGLCQLLIIFLEKGLQ
jgi:hypothetical protein